MLPIIYIGRSFFVLNPRKEGQRKSQKVFPFKFTAIDRDVGTGGRGKEKNGTRKPDLF